MKSSIFLLLAFLISCNLSAQITLENTFDEDVFWTTANGQTVYYSMTPHQNKINIYNEDYSLYKTVTINVPNGYKVTNVTNVSSEAFNSDNLIEFTCILTDTLGSYTRFLKLYNENGVQLFNFGEAYYGYITQTVNHDIRFCVYRTTSSGTKTDIYSLPGTIASIPSSNDGLIEKNPYPNPSHEYIYLQYHIDEAETDQLRIYNSNGQLLDVKNIGGEFDKIRLDVSNYVPGLYFYTYKSESKSFVVQ